MEKYQCVTGHKFSHLGTKTMYDFNNLPYTEAIYQTFIHPVDSVPVAKVDVPVCPICNTTLYSEIIEPTTTVESVYIYELTTGLQIELNSLLAQGYVIVNRYAKAYHLEKPKAVAPKIVNPDPDGIEVILDRNSEDTFTQDAKEYYDKLYAKLHPNTGVSQP